MTYKRNEKAKILYYLHRARHDSGAPARHMGEPESGNEVHLKETKVAGMECHKNTGERAGFRQQKSRICRPRNSVGEDYNGEGSERPN